MKYINFIAIFFFTRPMSWEWEINQWKQKYKIVKIKEKAFKVMNQNGDDTLLIEDNFSDDDLNEWTWEEKK